MPAMSQPVPCIRGAHGPDVDVYQTTIPAGDIEAVLGHDPRSTEWKDMPPALAELYQYVQRKTSKDRRAGTARYIAERLGPDRIYIGAFPALTIGMTRTARFESYPNTDKDVGILYIDKSRRNLRMLVDGIARYAGAMEMLESEDAAKYENLAFAVTIIVPTSAKGEITREELGQLFFDMTYNVAPMQRAHALALDRSDIYTILTDEIAALPLVQAAGGMEKRRPSLGSKSTALVVQQVLRRFVRGACEGKMIQHEDKAVPTTPNLTSATMAYFKDEIGHLLFMLRERLGDRFTDRSSILLSSPGWQALGLVFHDIIVSLKGDLTMDERATIITDVAAIDWSRYNPDWLRTIGHPEMDKKTGKPVTDGKGRQRVKLGLGGRQTVEGIADYMRGHSLLGKLLARRTAISPPSGQRAIFPSAEEARL